MHIEGNRRAFLHIYIFILGKNVWRPKHKWRNFSKQKCSSKFHEIIASESIELPLAPLLYHQSLCCSTTVWEKYWATISHRCSTIVWEKYRTTIGLRCSTIVREKYRTTISLRWSTSVREKYRTTISLRSSTIVREKYRPTISLRCSTFVRKKYRPTISPFLLIPLSERRVDLPSAPSF